MARNRNFGSSRNIRRNGKKNKNSNVYIILQKKKKNI